MKKILIVLICILLLTGCYDYKELSELALVSALSIEKEDDEFLVNVQSVNINDTNSKLETSPITIVSGSGKTLSEAMSNVNQKSSRVFFFSNIEYVLISPEVISEELDEVLDYLSRSTAFPLNYLVITSTDSKPKDILSALSKFDMSSYTNLSKLIKFNDGTGYFLTIKDLLKNYLEYGITPIYPNIYLKGDPEELSDIDTLQKSSTDSYLEIKSPVFFKDNKPVLLNKGENLGFNFLINNISNAFITSKCGSEYFTVETLSSKIGYEADLSKDTIKINGDVEAELVFYGCNKDLENDKNFEEFKNTLEETIESYIYDTLDLAKKNKTDFIGIGSYIFKNNNKYFDFKKNNWNNDGFPNLKFDVNIDITLNNQGNLRSDINE